MPQVGEKWFNLGVDEHVLTVGVIEHLFIDCPIVDQGCSHVPVGNHHAVVTTVLAVMTSRNPRFWGLNVKNQLRASRITGSRLKS